MAFSGEELCPSCQSTCCQNSAVQYFEDLDIGASPETAIVSAMCRSMLHVPRHIILHSAPKFAVETTGEFSGLPFCRVMGLGRQQVRGIHIVTHRLTSLALAVVQASHQSGLGVPKPINHELGQRIKAS